MALYPEPPILDLDQRPRKRGTFSEDNSTGQVTWLDPVSNRWRDAVRLDDIRRKVIDQASAGGKRYKFPKHSNKVIEDPLNVTSFLEEDEFYGYERKDRPDILFTLFEPTDRRCKKPTGYLMDEGRVCLDPYMHGIRDFAELPKTISAAVDGQDIEYWLRSNAAISRYDIMARMPSTYIMKGRQCTKPPSLNALTQRASRFRAKAGCLSWDMNAGTENKNNYILSLVSEECKKTNSTKAVTKDLEKTQIKAGLMTVNKGRFQQKRRKAKRAHEAQLKPESDKPGLNLVTKDSSHEVLGSERKRKRVVPTVAKDSGKEDRNGGPQLTKRRKAVTGTSPSRDDSISRLPKDTPLRRSPRKAGGALMRYYEIEDEVAGYTSDVDGEGDEVAVDEPSNGEPNINAFLRFYAPSGTLARYVIDVDDHIKPEIDEDFKLESEAALSQPKVDMRYVTPNETVERAHIRRALELTCIDFCMRKGEATPSELLAQHHGQSYEYQRRLIQKAFNRHWYGAKPVPKLYRLPAWTGGIGRWRVPKNDEQGRLLWTTLITTEKNAENMDLV